ncbi:TMV resistance protein N-like protein isoform X1 [Tanacetum coccineum]
MEYPKSFSSSSSSVPPTRGWTHDVFLSFRGEDTRNNFVDHLYAALIQKGINVFKDDEMLRGGNSVSTELLKAIDESRFAVVVFSKNYANSPWCLNELAKIMECQDKMGQKVLPVFYHVDPSDVRGQKRDFAMAFEEHEEKFSSEMDKVNKWRKALAGASDLCGYHISAVSGGEAAFINKIVQEILGGIPPRGLEKNLIGIESHMHTLNSLLNMEATKDVRIIGIYGMGGIGKTTIAQALFRRISYKFEGSSFVKHIKENSSSKQDICAIQEKILRDILMMEHGFMIQDPEYGADMIQERSCNKKVLLVLDDVDDVKQLEFLGANHECFGPGSRIIITTRDEHLLLDANDKYKPTLLCMDQAVELFSRHAFRKSCPPDEYKEVTNRAIHYSGRLPLALKVLGAFFRGRRAVVWGDALDRLAKTPNSEIFETLKLSFDDLNVLEQKIFLDIACFFKGKQLKDVTRILDSFGFHPEIGISSLIEKSLITVLNERLHMHDLLQEMGWQIIRECAPNSRLWQIDELDVIEAMVVPRKFYFDQEEQGLGLGFSANVFESMKNLRLLDVHHHFTSGEPTFLPDELQWLCWVYYPFSSLPVASNMHKLVGLEMKYGNIEHLWMGQKIMLSLKLLHLKNLDCLIEFPDVSMAPNIERLILARCHNLVVVHESLGNLKRLAFLEINSCRKLTYLPYRFEMESLEILIICCCRSLEILPEFSPCMAKLSQINFSFCFSIEELPSSIMHLSNLRFLNLTRCISLEKIPKYICEFKYLKRLSLAGCSKLQELPDVIGSMQKLQELHLGLVDSVNFPVLPNLSSLRKLDLCYRQIKEDDFPTDLHGLFSLEELNLSRNVKLIQLPTSISHLSRLKKLNLNGCCQLRSLLGLPSGLHILKASKCSSLESIEDLSKEYECLYKIWLDDCPKLLENPENEQFLDNLLSKPFLKKCAAVDGCLSIVIPGYTPSWFKEQNGNKTSLKLPPKWQTQILGFATWGVYEQSGLMDYDYPCISFRFESDGEFVTDLEADCINASSADENGNMWINYIPFSLFKHDDHNDDDDGPCYIDDELDHDAFDEDDDDDIQGEDWSHIIESNLIVDVSCGNIREKAVRCGAHVVYKENVESTQQTEPSLSSYYWKWKLSHSSQNVIKCTWF